MLDENKGWIIAGVSTFLFVLFLLILPSVVGFVVIVSTIWSLSGLTGFGLGRMMGKVEIEGDFYKDAKFYEHLAKGPISIYQYLQG